METVKANLPVSRSAAKYIVSLAVAVVVFYWKILLTNQYTLIIGSEGVNQSYAWLNFWVHSIRHWSFPLWDPYTFCGRPFGGEMLPSAFYPPHLLFALFPPDRNGMVSPKLFDVVLALTHLLCAYFAFALLRELKLSRYAALLGATCCALSGIATAMIWPPYIDATIWLPAIFFFLLRALRTGETRQALLEAALSGLCLGMSILSGGIQFSIMQGIVVATAVLYYAGAATPGAGITRRSHWLRAGLIFAIVVAVAAGSGAVQLLPGQEYSTQSFRFIDGGAVPSAHRIPYDRLVAGTWPQSIVTTLFPTGFDGKIAGREGWSLYIGVFPFFLAATGVWKRWSNLWVRYLTGLAALSFLYMLSEFSPLHGVLYAIVPYLWVVRAASRFVYLVLFALSVLAAFGIDELLDPAHPSASWAPARRLLKWCAIACAAALIVPGVFSQLALGVWTCLSLLLILASCWLYAYLTQHSAGPWTRALAVAFILFDLTAFHWLPASQAALSKGDDQLAQMVSLRGAAEFVRSQPGPSRVRVAVEPQPNVGDVYRVQSAWGGGATVLADYALLSSREDLLNVRYRIKPASAQDPGAIYWDAKWKVYEDRNAFPRAWVVHQTMVEGSREAVLRRIADPAVNLRTTAVLEAAPVQKIEPATGYDGVHFASYQANRMSLDVTASGAGLVVLSEFHYPGWHATVNGTPAEIQKVDGGLRGIAVPAGQSRVELTYAPLTIYGGGAVSLLTFAGVLSWLTSNWRKRVRARRQPDVATTEYA